MSTEKIHFQNFEEIAGRLKKEFGFKKDRQLIDILEIPQPTYNSRKTRNNFSAEWVVLLSMKYKFQVRWILTGEGPKKTDGTDEKPIGNKFLLQVAEWLEDVAQRDPRKPAWFELQFESLFPEFKTWILKQRIAEGDQHRRAV
ncbi:MAG: helix-turn-helix domain-containing protein [Candidatus Electronema sp. V4]|uniref:helix-turn-helix domain-containing protein n=1 Tax=Candidatus Electronema sp. V4 TaxID=3454756 RepID=UPI0040555CE7